MKKFAVFIMHQHQVFKTKKLRLYYSVGSLIYPNEAKTDEDMCFDNFVFLNFQVNENSATFTVRYESDFEVTYSLTKEKQCLWSGPYTSDKENGIANCFIFES